MQFHIKSYRFAQHVLSVRVRYIPFHIGSRENPVKSLASGAPDNIIYPEWEIVQMIQNIRL